MGGVPTNYHGEVLRPTKDDPEAYAQALWLSVGPAYRSIKAIGLEPTLFWISSFLGELAAIRAGELVEKGAQ